MEGCPCYTSMLAATPPIRTLLRFDSLLWSGFVGPEYGRGASAHALRQDGRSGDRATIGGEVPGRRSSRGYLSRALHGERQVDPHGGGQSLLRAPRQDALGVRIPRKECFCGRWQERLVLRSSRPYRHACPGKEEHRLAHTAGPSGWGNEGFANL